MYNNCNAITLKLCDPATSLDECVVLAGKMMRSDPLFDFTLAAQLANLQDDGMDVWSALRLLRVLDAISPGSRLITILERLMCSSNAHLRSSAARLLAKRVQQLRSRDDYPHMQWIRKYLQDADPRVRANVIEALWGNTSPDMIKVLRKAAEDSHHRVATNAVLGLYKIGEPDAGRLLVDMALDGSAAFRCAAVWAMGQTGDTQFLETLINRLRHDESEKVRSMALRSIMGIKATELKPNQNSSSRNDPAGTRQ